MCRHAVLAPLLLFAISAASADEVSISATGETTQFNTPEPVEVNPYQADGDQTTECYSWAADGQCGVNPGYMLQACKYSCWEWYAAPRVLLARCP